MTDKRSEYTAGLRALADLLDQHPDLPLPESELSWGVHGQDDPKAAIARIARAVPVNCEKWYDDDYFRMRFSLHGFKLRVWATREQVCTKVVTGTQEVTKMVPAANTEYVEVTETVETVEWICEPLLAEVSS
jgi:hypothetical protein